MLNLSGALTQIFKSFLSLSKSKPTLPFMFPNIIFFIKNFPSSFISKVLQPGSRPFPKMLT